MSIAVPTDWDGPRCYLAATLWVQGQTPRDLRVWTERCQFLLIHNLVGESKELKILQWKKSTEKQA